MKCFIYKIVNNVTQEKYVGQTTNFSRRINDHFSKLRQNKHPNPKLQASWNKYGEENFSVTKEKFDLTKEELDLKEIEEIAKENSFEHGFNLTIGGTGGDTKSKIPLEIFYEIYFGNKKYDGLTTRTAAAYHCDSSTVSAIRREVAYDTFREKALQLPLEEQEKYTTAFENKLYLKDKPAKPIKKKIDNRLAQTFLCLLSTYGRGIEAAFIRCNGLSKGLGFHMSKGEYVDAQKLFLLKTDQEIWDIADTYFQQENLQQYCTQTIKRKEQLEKPSWIAHVKSL